MSEFLDLRLVLRTSDPRVDCVGLVDIGLGGGCKPPISDRVIGEETGVGDAIVPPIPGRDVGGASLSGALRVIEQHVGIKVTDDVFRAGLWGEPIAITKGMLGFDAALSLRSGGGDAWVV